MWYILLTIYLITVVSSWVVVRLIFSFGKENNALLDVPITATIVFMLIPIVNIIFTSLTFSFSLNAGEVEKIYKKMFFIK